MRVENSSQASSNSNRQFNPFSLAGKLALITGGGTGLGLGMAQAVIDAGGKVILTGRREEVLREAVAQLGEKEAYMVHDITDLASIPALAQAVNDRFGKLDILINNAGIHHKQDAVETSDTDFEKVLLTHVHGAFAMTREFAPSMIKRKEGSIIFISSMSAIMGMPKVIAYSAAKTAVSGMVRALASEFSPHGVRVNAIVPGWIESEMSNKALNSDPERKRKVMSRTPLGHMGKPADIGHAAVFLASPAAQFITGAELRVDGGAGIGF
ncbi:SDR family NAD(P)-dependent oxidoreductase [Paenibacillus yanchengensis]|uniref:SDR family NAD(P)-dependent oxidoreductase n=1 Tax=Paenibacillus yanchengensis TaxID=2035833 RepID=A0ABW4YF49_9BACL